VADNPGKIMAALKHPYKDPNANISKAPHPLPSRPPSIISHNFAATTLKPSQTTLAAKPTNLSPIKTNSPANIKGAKRSPKKTR
jgi:hypothetical protein